MKKTLCLVAVIAVALVACSKNKKDDSTVYYDANGNVRYTANAKAANNGKAANDVKYQIIDQEFDNLLAPDTDYDSVPAYELQACGESYLPLVEPDCCNGKAKVAAKGKAKAKAAVASVETTRAKKITNTTNIYYVDGPNPSVPVSSTTTTKTVYKNGAVASTTTSSSNQKTTVNPDGSVTTTTVNY